MLHPTVTRIPNYNLEFLEHYIHSAMATTWRKGGLTVATDALDLHVFACFRLREDDVCG